MHYAVYGWSHEYEKMKAVRLAKGEKTEFLRMIFMNLCNMNL